MSSVNEREEYGLMFKGVQFYYFHPTTSKTAMADNVLVNRSPQAVILNAHRNPLWSLVNWSFQTECGQSKSNGAS